MGIYIPPQGDVTINESAIKNTDAEIRDGVWADSTKADGANISFIYANTSAILKNSTSVLVDGDNILANTSSLIGSNSTIDVVVDGIKAVTDLLPDSGALSSIGTVANQSLILTDGDNLMANTSSVIGSNSTIDVVVDAIKVITDALPDSGALTSIGTVVNQSLILTDGDNLLANTSSLIASNTTIDVVVDAIKVITDALPDSGALSSIATVVNQSLILTDGDNLLANTSSLIGSNSTIDVVVDAIKAVTDVLPDSGALTSLGTIINQSLILTDGDNLLANTSSLIGSNSTIDVVVDAIKVITDAIPDSGAMTSIGSIANQSLILTDGDNLLANTSSLIGSNSTIDTVVDGIKTITDALPDSGALTSIASIANQSLILTDGDNLLANTSSLIASNTTIDVVVDAIKVITDAIPDSGAMTSIATIENQSLILTDGDNLLANTSSLIASNTTIDTVVDAIKVITDALPDSGTLVSIGASANQTAMSTDLDTIIENVSDLMLEAAHPSYVFPSNSNDYVIFRASPTANEFSNWSNIISQNSSRLMDRFNLTGGHISSIMVEEVDTDDSIYLFQLAYGTSKNHITCHRFVNGNTQFLPTVQQIRVRAPLIPANETLYYRMKCETENASCKVSFRYHYH